MKIVLMCFVSVVIVSETFATRDFIGESPGETQENDSQSADESVEVESISDVVSFEELNLVPKKRSKKSYQPELPCAFCDQRPTLGYNSQHRPGDNYYSLPPKSHHQASAAGYSSPNYNPPNYNGPSYNGPSYNGPSYNGPSYNGPSYNGPSYNGPNYNGPSYNGPSYNGPSYNGPSYNGPSYNGQSYNGQNYNGPNYNGPSYNGPNYNSPSYPQPAYNSYSNNKHPTSVYPSPSNFYPQHSNQPRHSYPSSNLLVGCQPHVSPFPDMGYLPQFYDQQQLRSPPSQRFHPHDDSSVAASKGPDFTSNEMMPEKIPLLDAPTGKADNLTVPKNEINDTAAPIDVVEKAKVEQQGTLSKMAQLRNQMPKGEDKPKKEPLTGKKN